MIVPLLALALASAPQQEIPRLFEDIAPWQVYSSDSFGECVAIETFDDGRMFSVHYWPAQGRAAVFYIDAKLGAIDADKSYPMHVGFVQADDANYDARDVTVAGYRSTKGVPGFMWDLKSDDMLGKLAIEGAIVFRNGTGFMGGASMAGGRAVAASLRRCGGQLKAPPPAPKAGV